MFSFLAPSLFMNGKVSLHIDKEKGTTLFLRLCAHQCPNEGNVLHLSHSLHFSFPPPFSIVG
jgi:hypothetical protein